MARGGSRTIIAAICEGMLAMADYVAWDLDVVRQRALVLLSVADSVKSEGWDDGVAAQLRRAARDLVEMVTDPSARVIAKQVSEIPGPG
jgi:hypothetical protein